MSSKKNTTPISLQPLDELFGTTGDGANGICEVSVSSLHSFPNHPFKVKNDKKMEELVKSVTEYGVLVPGIVRMRSAGGYELVAGHRRRRACEIAGIQKMPVIIKDLTDDEATVIMVDSNIQREELLFSEKAFAYKMKYDALKRQGKRTDLTSCRVGKKSAAEEVSQNTEDSARQVLRYIHLTELITELLYLTDIKKLPFNTAVELSYLKKDEQQLLMRNPISNETVEFNDNCVSLFVAQRGKCAICKLPLTLENMRCVRKIPKSCGGDDKYNNLIIVHKEMERLIKSQDNKEIKRILNKYKLESNQRRKVNTIRKNAGLEEIDVKALDKEL